MAQATVGSAFIGRAGELRLARDSLAAAAGGWPSVVVVGGDAGVGKTRFLRELAAAAGDEARVLWGGCLPLGERGLPLGPVAQVVRDLSRRRALPDPLPSGLERLLPGSTGGPIARSTGQVRMFQAVLELLEELARERTVMFVVEDLHWADRSTRELFTFLAYNLRDQRLVVLGSFRADDLAEDHPLVADLAEWRRNPLVHRVDLRPFDPLETADHLADLLGERARPDVVEAVLARSEGNPFFIEELVAAGTASGGPMPDSLRELMLARARAPDPVGRRLLRFAAASAGRVDEEVLAAVCGLPPDEVGQHLRDLVSRRLLFVDEAGYRFRHALLSEALHEDLGPRERREIHRSFARVLDDRPELRSSGEAASTAELAHHWQEAGDRPRSLAAWVRAAAAAESVLAFSESRHDLERVLELWDAVPDAESLAGQTKVELLRRAAEHAFLGDDPDRAVALARRAIELVDADADPMAAGLLHERLARYLWDTSEQSEALAMHRRAVELVPPEPSEERAGVLAGLAGQLMVLGRHEEARRVAEEALELARAVGATRAEYVTLDTLGTLVGTTEDVAEGVALLERALAMAREAGDSFEQMRALWNLLTADFQAARWGDAVELFEVCRREFPKLGQAHEVLPLQISAADCLVRLGRWDEAEELVEDARRRQRPGGATVGLPELDIGRGRFERARAHYERQLADGVYVSGWLAAWPRIGRAEMACWEGEPAAARTFVREGLDLIADQDESLDIAYLCAVGLRAEADIAVEARSRGRRAAAEEAVPIGRDLLERARGLMARPGPADGWKREVGALVAQCEAEARRLLGEPDPDAWSGSVAAWERLSMPYHAACGRWRLAEALLALGDREGARRELELADEVATSLRAEPLRRELVRLARRGRIDLGDVPAVPGESSLTPREREVLALVAAGQSNRQIARALFITEKTASVHVSNILAKLSVSSRGEAAALAHREGLVG